MMELNGKTGYLFLLTPLMASEQDPPAASGGRFMKGQTHFCLFVNTNHKRIRTLIYVFVKLHERQATFYGVCEEMAGRRLRQKDHEFEDSPDCLVRSISEKKSVVVDYCAFTHMHVCMEKCEGQRGLPSVSVLASESTRVSHMKFHGSSPDRLDFVCACTSLALSVINSWKKTFCNFCPHWPSLTVTHTPLNEQLKQLSANPGAAFLSSFEVRGRILIPGLGLKSQDSDTLLSILYPNKFMKAGCTSG